jgi:hypothetical protein
LWSLGRATSSIYFVSARRLSLLATAAAAGESWASDRASRFTPCLFGLLTLVLLLIAGLMVLVAVGFLGRSAVGLRTSLLVADFADFLSFSLFKCSQKYRRFLRDLPLVDATRSSY